MEDDFRVPTSIVFDVTKDPWWVNTDEREQMFQHIRWAKDQVERLPECIFDDELEGQVRGACLESFFVNARLLAEFFTRDSFKDFSARDLVPDWDPKPEELVDRLRAGIWQEVSQHIVHLSKKRINAGINSTMAELCQIRDDILTLWSEFDALLKRRDTRPV